MTTTTARILIAQYTRLSNALSAAQDGYETDTASTRLFAFLDRVADLYGMRMVQIWAVVGE